MVLASSCFKHTQAACWQGLLWVLQKSEPSKSVVRVHAKALSVLGILCVGQLVRAHAQKPRVQITTPAPRDRGYNIRRVFWWPRGCGLGDVEVHVQVTAGEGGVVCPPVCLC